MDRILAFRQALRTPAAAVHRPENIRWLSGFTGEGCLYISENAAVILTDFRYIEQAERQAPGWRIERTTADRKEASILKALCAADGVCALSAETDCLTWDAVDEMSRTLEGVAIEPLAGAVQTLRMVKDADEIECIRKACAISCKALENILPRMRPGMTEKQVQIMLDYEMLALGSEGNAFNTIAAAGENGSLPHAIPSDRAIRSGELLTLDFGAKVGGYCADMTRTIGFGRVSAELRELYEYVRTAQQAALDILGPGAVCGDLDKAARDRLEARYPGAFGHSLGHGVGLFIHEQPRLAKDNAFVLEPGNVVTVEPGVYIPGLGGCRIEDTTIITRDGFIDPVTFPKELIEL